jgi:hypothetical protein
MSQEFVTITMDEYNELIDAVDFLACLEACGVDNWSGYADAVEMFEEEEPIIVATGIISGVDIGEVIVGEIVEDELYEDEEDEWY